MTETANNIGAGCFALTVVLACVGAWAIIGELAKATVYVARAWKDRRKR